MYNVMRASLTSTRTSKRDAIGNIGYVYELNLSYCSRALRLRMSAVDPVITFLVALSRARTTKQRALALKNLVEQV